MKLSSIKFLKDAKDFMNITERYSGAFKYSFLKNEKRYFLKIGHFKIDEELENILSEAGIFHPKIVEMGTLDEEHNYIIEEYAKGNNLKHELDNYDGKFIYEFGFKIGKQYGNLRKKFPDIPVSKEFMSKHQQDVDNRMMQLENLKSKTELSQEQITFIDFIIQYLKKHFDLMKCSRFVFGHTDVKPSNFIIHKKDIIATDIEHTDYKELSLSLIWSYARNDKKDKKSICFAQGYLDGLYNLNVPEEVLKAFNYTYIYNMADYCIKYVQAQDYEALDKLITKVTKDYLENDKVIIDKKLKSNANIRYFPKLKDYDFHLVEGSYNPDNLTFHCVNENQNYFLKIMKMSKERFQRILKQYQLLEEANVPISPVRDYGVCKEDECYFVLFDFIPYKEMNQEQELTTFEVGNKYGELVAKYLKPLREKTFDGMHIFDYKKLYSDIVKRVDSVYRYDNCEDYIKWTKEETIKYIDYCIEFFKEEPLRLIRGDIKFGNILYDGKDNLIFVDNESLTYSYDIINFLYNIQNGFQYDAKDVYCGFVSGYLTYMNNGMIPKSIEEQIKLLLIYYLFRITLNFLEKKGKDSEIAIYMSICEEYIGQNKKIEWL